jgi:hypothetical protein
VDHSPSSSVEVKERVELYLYSASGLLWPVIRLTLLFTEHRLKNNLQVSVEEQLCEDMELIDLAKVAVLWPAAVGN